MLSAENRMKIGELFLTKRKELKKTQDEICQYLSDYGISDHVYKRAERGKSNVSLSALAKIADALKVDLNSIIPDAINLKFLILNSPDNEMHFFNSNAKKYYSLSHSEENADVFHKLNLFRFILYLPLFPPECLFDVLQRIGGDFINREGYIINKLEWLFREIPVSPAVRFAQHMDKYILHIEDANPECEQQWQINYALDDSYKENYKSYLEKLDSLKHAFDMLKYAIHEMNSAHNLK